MPQEADRARVVRALELLDAAAQPELDTIVAGARELFGTKTAFIAIVDEDRLRFRSRCNLAIDALDRTISFCDRAIVSDAALIVPDALADPGFATNPLVTGAPFVRFYAGVPLHARSDADSAPVAVGTLCVVDDRPHWPTPEAIDMLKGMAHVIEALLELRRVSRESLALALERHDTLTACERVSRQLSQAERMANIGSWRLDLATEQVTWSDQTYAIHALPRSEGTDLSRALDHYPPADRARIAAAVAACAEHGRGYDLEVDFVDAAGRRRRLRAIGEPETENGRTAAIIGVVQDITERHRLEQRLREQAQTDELTGLASRRAFNELIDAELADRIDDEPLAVALLDLDCFKAVNDRFGHAAGDEVLRTTAAILASAPYLGDHVAARLGGDEFVLLLRGVAAGAALEQVLAQLLAALRQRVGGAITVSATIGACRFGPGLTGRSALLKAADRALYRAKQSRRGTGAIDGADRLIEATAMAEAA